jgi:predicted CxxxxCH...CXXCH cytochrome family protein
MKATYNVLLIFTAAVMLVVLTATGASAVIGAADSKHNLTDLSGYGFNGDLCAGCHKPHDSVGKRLWTPDRNTVNDGMTDLDAAKALSTDQTAGTGDYPGIYLCLDCHGSPEAPVWAAGAASAKTHSTSEMQAAGYTTKHENFVTQCTDCHDPHQYWNGTFTGGQNGYMIKDSIVTPNSGTRTVVFTAMTGPGSMGTNTSPYDSVCEVCHTTTTYHTNSGAPAHNDRKNCTSCHLHNGGFSAKACDSCHGNPPTTVDTLVGGTANPGSAPTGATTPGMHAFHTFSTAGGAGYGCAVCHRAGMGDGEGADMQIDVRFGFAGYTSGSFDGFTPISGYTFSPGNTTGGSLGCSNTYCHGNFPGGITTNVPVWDDSSTGVCGTCHGIAPPLLADHSVHLTATWGPRASCDDCHPAGSNTGSHASHVDGVVSFKDGQDLANTTVCNSCHGTTAATKPTWGDSSVRGQTSWCESCHDGSSTVNTAAGTAGADVSAPNIMGDGISYGFEVTGHGKPGIAVSCDSCHLATSMHIDGNPQTYSASLNNYKEGYRLDLYNVTPNLGNYSSTKIALCYSCHIENRVVGMPAGGRPSALHMHSVITSSDWYTDFRNMSTTAGLFAGNWDSTSESGYSYDIPTNIHWNHLDDYGSSRRLIATFATDMYIYDSDGDGTGDSRITCDTCHNPHGTKSPSMVLEDFSLSTYSVAPNPSYRWLGSDQYVTTRCSTTACHTYGDVENTGGTRYYREKSGLSTVFGVPWGLKANPLP